MKYEKSCGTIIIDNGKVLIVKHNKGHWDFPKGHIENDETEVETALRETKEETNLDVLIDENRRYTISYKLKKNAFKTVVYFKAIPINNDIKPQLEEIAEIKWFDFKEAIKIITYDDTKELFRKFLKEVLDVKI